MYSCLPPVCVDRAGNISTAALVAPMAMTTAMKANIPLFLMAIMVVTGERGVAVAIRADRIIVTD